MPKLVFATNNKNKLKEVKAQLPKHIDLLSLDDIGCFEDIPETQPTIAANAMQKAQYVKTNYGYDCFADDTGLEVEALGGAPGVFSARYAGPEKIAEKNVAKLLKEMKNTENRKAQFKTVIALIFEEKEYLFEGICKGEITHQPTGNQGFGYDPVFQPNGFVETFAQMDLTQKTAIGHRGKAVEKLIDFFDSKA